MSKSIPLALLIFTVMGTTADRYSELKNLGPLPQYVVESTWEKMVIDGKLSEPAWSRAAPITLRFPWEYQSGKKQNTTVRMLRDAGALYVSYEAEDTDITATYLNRDDPTYKDDCVEIFIRPSQDSDSYIGMEMNARGVLFDYLYPFPKDYDKRLNLEGVELKTTRQGTLNQSNDRDTSWTLEVSIPFKNFGRLSNKPTPRSGEKWRVQINRWDGTEASGGRRLSMWCHSGLKEAHPHNPDRFGIVTFK